MVIFWNSNNIRIRIRSSKHYSLTSGQETQSRKEESATSNLLIPTTKNSFEVLLDDDAAEEVQSEVPGGEGLEAQAARQDVAVSESREEQKSADSLCKAIGRSPLISPGVSRGG